MQISDLVPFAAPRFYTMQFLYFDFSSRLTNSLGTQGKIYYEPDEGDDWDEEDPDDDLDF